MMLNNSNHLNKQIIWKNRRKAIRSVLQFIVIIIVGYLIVNALLSLKSYNESDKSTWNNYDDFIAVSYFGVARSTTGDHVSKKELGAQLKALADHGYVTISQQDLIDFYTKKAPLPNKALFLGFEDGRNDSALFSTKLLEKYNFKATMLTYANKMGSDQGKFLQPKELLSMTKKGFWELGTNGYRLTYINILDKNKQYFEQLTQEEFSNKSKAYHYTHYLMDFIRDDNNIPIENRDLMEERIRKDYELMNQIYTRKLGYVPSAYMIMHADTLYNGMNNLVEHANDEQIRKLFHLHFNREGKMLNTSSMNKFDLTRVQPAPYWRTNHLIMKLGIDTKDEVSFVMGDEHEAEKWSINAGVTEFASEEIALTTRPSQLATMTLKQEDLDSHFALNLTIGGHTSGVQLVELGSSQDAQLSLRLRIQEDNLYVEQVHIDGTIDRLLAVRGKNKAVADIPISVVVEDQTISLSLRNNVVMDHEAIDPSIDTWHVKLQAESLKQDNRWEDEGDHIYDGIFKRITLANLNDKGKVEQIVYSNHLKGISKVSFTIKRVFHQVIDWAIDAF